MKIVVTSFKRSHACTATLSVPNWESLPRQIDEKSRVPKGRGGWGSQSGDRGLEFSRRRKEQTFFSSTSLQFSSVHFSHSVVSDSLRLRELQHARPPCPSPTPGIHSNSHPSSRWCHPALVLVNYTTQFKLGTRDYTRTMYPAIGQFLLPENLMTNPDILECILWEWVW